MLCYFLVTENAMETRPSRHCWNVWNCQSATSPHTEPATRKSVKYLSTHPTNIRCLLLMYKTTVCSQKTWPLFYSFIVTATDLCVSCHNWIFNPLTSLIALPCVCTPTRQHARITNERTVKNHLKWLTFIKFIISTVSFQLKAVIYLATPVWPWPWPRGLDTRPWPSCSADVMAHEKWSF